MEIVNNTPNKKTKRNNVAHGALLALTLLLIITQATASRAGTVKGFATDRGLGPDKWASIWLVHRHIRAGQAVHFVEEQNPNDPAPAEWVLFDTPNAAYRRNTQTTTFEQLLTAYPVDAPVAQDLAQIIHDIEVNTWQADQREESAIVERAYRQLQKHHGRHQVPYDCYITFFDHVAQQLEQHQAGQRANLNAKSLNVKNLHAAGGCTDTTLQQILSSKQWVPEIPIETVAKLIRQGKHISFVDVREPEEFVEQHIPGAFNIPIRDLDEQALAVLKPADLVVSYCVKDFRAFEMAKKLQDLGLKQAVILTPYGLRGWLASGLPVVRNSANQSYAYQRNSEELNLLKACLNREPHCGVEQP